MDKSPQAAGRLASPEKPFCLWEIMPAIALALGICGQIAWMDPRHWDLALAYRGGVEAWATGHPENVRSWMSTPFLGMTMAVVSHLMSEETAMRVLVVLSLGLVGIAFGGVWGRLRGRVPRSFWWVSLTLALSFAPLLSSLYYKQFNVLAVSLAVGGFLVIRTGRGFAGSLLIGLSVALKPLVVLLPFALVARRDTRRTGIISLAAVLFLSLFAQAFLAARAGDAAVLSPIPNIQNFQGKAEHWVFSQENFSPRGLFCRLATQAEEPPLTRAAASLVVLLLVLVANRVLRDEEGRSWAVFGFACLLSPMVGPVAWAHYQLLELPLLLLLALEFLGTRAGWRWWGLLLTTVALSDLLLRPLDDSVPGALASLFTGRHETLRDLWAVMAVSQFGQYVLCGTALAWFAKGRPE